MLKKSKPNFTCNDCLTCLQSRRCVRASSLPSQYRKFFLSHLGYHQEENELMRKGTEVHAEYFKMYPMVEELTGEEFIKKIYAGEEVIVREASICAPNLGLRGHMDLVNIQYNKETKTFNITISELKRKPWWPYIFQLCTYGLIFNDPKMFLHYKIKMPRSEKIITVKFYPQDTPFNVNVTGKILYYHDDFKNKKPHKVWLVKDNVFVNRNYFGVHAKLKKFRKLMEAGEFYLHNIKMCEPCWEERCSFYDICKKFPFSKDIQMHHGKRQILKKSR